MEDINVITGEKKHTAQRLQEKKRRGGASGSWDDPVLPSGDSKTSAAKNPAKDKKDKTKERVTAQTSEHVATDKEDLDKQKKIKEEKNSWGDEGSGKCVGDIRMEAKKTINLQGLGKYSGTWYLKKVTHRIKVGEVYTVDFEVTRKAASDSGKESSKPKNPSGKPPAKPKPVAQVAL